ncbi:hypothetical protein CEXT_54861 [Caerostris extrusa]|uniref:Uncharacterized protein n=1 Tax=Caerostris extrusa TaxID=172846 RepID=A0AAV4XBS3_CAEEX|nr:hypothetical protein CEXT_54861 [Caerostris extrusa]
MMEINDSSEVQVPFRVGDSSVCRQDSRVRDSPSPMERVEQTQTDSNPPPSPPIMNRDYVMFLSVTFRDLGLLGTCGEGLFLHLIELVARWPCATLSEQLSASVRLPRTGSKSETESKPQPIAQLCVIDLRLFSFFEGGWYSIKQEGCCDIVSHTIPCFRNKNPETKRGQDNQLVIRPKVKNKSVIPHPIRSGPPGTMAGKVTNPTPEQQMAAKQFLTHCCRISRFN